MVSRGDVLCTGGWDRRRQRLETIHLNTVTLRSLVDSRVIDERAYNGGLLCSVVRYSGECVPTPRNAHQMCSLPASGRGILHGGWDGRSRLDDTEVFEWHDTAQHTKFSRGVLVFVSICSQS